MAVIERPTTADIDEAVSQELTSCGALSFPALEEKVLARDGRITNPILVRQAAWRLIGRKRARLLPDMRVALTDSAH